MLEELLMALVYSIVTFFYGSVFVILFLDISMDSKKDILIFVIFSVVILGIQCFIGYMISIKTVVVLYPLIVHFPLFLLCIIYYKKNALTTISAILMSYFLTSPRYVLAEIVAGIFKGIPYPDSMGKIIASILLAFPICKWVVPVLRKSFKRSSKDIMHFFVPLILVYVFSYSVYVYTDLIKTNSIVMMEILFTLFFLVILYYIQEYFVSIDNMHEKEKRNQLLEMSAEAVKKQLDTLNESNEYTRILRHDMRHYATMVKQYAESGDTDKVISISEEIEAKNSAGIVKSYCDNPWIDLLLNIYLSQLADINVKPELEITVPKEMAFHDMDLCVILGNILDNAVRSIGTCSKNRFCKIFCSYNGGKLCLEVKNSCETAVPFQDEVPLSNRSGHGYGCKSIVYIAEKYRGMCSFDLKENIFTTRVILYE